MTTKPYEFPQSQVDSTGAGPDFPASSGDRERGKFRPSVTPRLTQVAVTGDEGEPLVGPLQKLLEEMLLYQKATVLGLSLLVEEDLLKKVSE